ncbi:MAG: hypothetical protein A2X76_07880 [Lysobacterales bacterium GWF1_69_6]|nr:MAG: hypothetical protein A2X76_07880 [Xanthomonadales bacterium GWF1_69_6]
MTRLLLSLATLLLLAACAGAGGTLQPAGRVQVFDLQLETSLDWARIKGARQELWTVDGSPLNQLNIVSRVKPGEHVFQGSKATKRRPDGPWFRPGMRPDEIRDLVADGLALSGWSAVRANGLRPADFGGVPGLRFELGLANGRGLRYRGQAAAAERDGRLTLLVWLAPEEHYYPRDAEAVSRTLDRLRFLP